MNGPVALIRGWPRLACLALVVAVSGCTTAAPQSSLPVDVIRNVPRTTAETPPPPPASEPTVTYPLDEDTPVPAGPQYADIYERIRAGYQLQDVQHRDVTAEFNWFVRNEEYLNRVFGRGQRYLHYITGELERRNMPLELALLPLVESAFNPFAYSRAHASGLWQFITPTGRTYGLRQNYWQDQRRDVIESTRAALDFLQELERQFNGDWLLAVAAYNTGAGNVQKAIRRNRAAGRPTDFFSLKLPKETRAYVPKLLAIRRLVLDPAAYGVALEPVPNAAYFDVLDLDGPVDLRLAAAAAGLETEELHALNPSHHRWITDPGGPHRLLVPVAVADEAAARLAALEPHERAGLAKRSVAFGESLDDIARAHDVTVAALRDLNGVKAYDVKAGDELLVPTAELAPMRAGLIPRDGGGSRRVHTVRSGETLTSVGRRYGMSPAQVAKLNGISAKSHLRIGQRLTVRGSAGGSNASTAKRSGGDSGDTRKIRYTVKRGDTLSEISRKFDVTLAQLRSWNGLGKKSAIRAGQRLTIHVDSRRDYGG